MQSILHSVKDVPKGIQQALRFAVWLYTVSLRVAQLRNGAQFFRLSHATVLPTGVIFLLRQSWGLWLFFDDLQQIHERLLSVGVDGEVAGAAVALKRLRLRRVAHL